MTDYISNLTLYKVVKNSSPLATTLKCCWHQYWWINMNNLKMSQGQFSAERVILFHILSTDNTSVSRIWYAGLLKYFYINILVLWLKLMMTSTSSSTHQISFCNQQWPHPKRKTKTFLLPFLSVNKKIFSSYVEYDIRIQALSTELNI